ncbi:MAG: rhomboid family intramembrane serine protease [Spirochaetaceae bacterium]|jgi:membrane associated rhomboid family serine protease|nr:rhomboid family intramembrane serine protease [Spirochaetaceae bacterium]
MSLIRKPFRYSYTRAALYLIAANVVIYILQLFSRDRITSFLALNPYAIIHYKMIWQFVTYMFVHSTAGWSHLLFNMIALFLFGTALERHIGSKEFTLYYFVTGTVAGVLSFAVYAATGVNPWLLGASGALFAVQLAYAAFFPDSYIYIWGILPLRAPIMVLLFTGIELVSGLTGRADGTAHATHLFGFLAGTLYSLIRWRLNPFKLMFARR